MRGVADWCAFYRENVHRFVEDYLHVELRLFQKIILLMMNLNTITVFIAARGIGKSYLSAIFCVCRCILYPGTKICIASGTRGQSLNVFEKINIDLKPNSPELCAEIDERKSKINGTDAVIIFKNGSFIKVVTAGDSARGSRANILLLDEARMIKKDVIDAVLRKFLTQRRMPKYSRLSKAERLAEYDKEKNMTLYLTSAYWSDSWIYQKCVDTFKAMMVGGKKQFVCGIPYYLALQEGLLDRTAVEDDMAESDFSEILFSMESCALFYGAGEDSFFDYATLSKARHVKYPMLPERISSILSTATQIRIQDKIPGEIRILSADIALMSSKKNNNDASALFVNSMTPTKSGRYMRNIVYTEAFEGMRTEEQALIIRKYFDEFLCDYIVLDAQGVGSGVYDALSRDITDPDTGEIYPALSCCNNAKMAARCVNPGAKKVIWAIKANAQFNSECALWLRDGFRSGRIRLLQNEYDAEELLSALKGYDKLSPPQKTKILLAYVNTTLLIDELVKLQHEDAGGGKVRLYERSNMRKDRYSSLSYNYWVSVQLEMAQAKRDALNLDLVKSEMFIIKPPKSGGRDEVSYGGRFG
jgi:hypothetical protein